MINSLVHKIVVELLSLTAMQETGTGNGDFILFFTLYIIPYNTILHLFNSHNDLSPDQIL